MVSAIQAQYLEGHFHFNRGSLDFQDFQVIMVRLDTATKVIRLYLDNPVATNELDWNASWDDLKPSITRAFTPMALNGASNGTTPVVMVTAPSALHYNNVKYISVHNNDTVQRGITIELFDGVNSR